MTLPPKPTVEHVLDICPTCDRPIRGVNVVRGRQGRFVPLGHDTDTVNYPYWDETTAEPCGHPIELPRA